MKRLIDDSVPVRHVVRQDNAGSCQYGKLSTLMVPLAALLWLVSANPLRAGIIFNDYGPAYTYNTGIGWAASGPTSTVGSFTAANEFTPTITAAVSSVDFGLSLDSGTNSVTMEITTDNAGVPGTVLESYTFVNQMGAFGNQNAPLTATSVLHPVLDAGTNYWIVGVPGASNTSAVWNWNNQGVTGTDKYSQNGGVTWNSNGTQPLGASEIFGDPVVVPEPSSLALVGMAVALLLSQAWRRKRRPALAS